MSRKAITEPTMMISRLSGRGFAPRGGPAFGAPDETTEREGGRDWAARRRLAM
jgi:hypothetical protein